MVAIVCRDSTGHCFFKCYLLIVKYEHILTQYKGSLIWNLMVYVLSLEICSIKQIIFVIYQNVYQSISIPTKNTFLQAAIMYYLLLFIYILINLCDYYKTTKFFDIDLGQQIWCLVSGSHSPRVQPRHIHIWIGNIPFYNKCYVLVQFEHYRPNMKKGTY